MNNYIKMNNNDNHLSLGNLFNIIKDVSKNKMAAIQTEIFCTLMGIDNISESTVNNYCTGYRSINDTYKQIYLNYQKNYIKDEDVLIPVINNLLSIVDGIIYEYNSINDINKNSSLKIIVDKLHSICKNDIYVNNKWRKEIFCNINKKNYYQAFSLMLFFIIIEKKQPLYEKEELNETILEIVENTNLGINDLKKILKIQFTEGISRIPSLKKLAKENNPYALYELGNMEYYGEIVGYSRYEEAFKYHKMAADLDHPSSCWMIAHMIINKKIGTLSKVEFDLAWKYLKKAESLDSVSAINTIGLCYLRGYVNDNKDIDKAKEYFLKAAKKKYIFAYNNLGYLYENDGNYEEAFKYYMLSAEMEESWACNKVAEFYRQGKYVDIDMNLAFKYYSLGAESPLSIRCNYNIINLVRYFYMNGNAVVGINKDIDKAIKLLMLIPNDNESIELLLYCYYEKYLEDKSYLNKVIYYLELINDNILFDKDRKKRIQDNINNLEYRINI